MTSSPQDIVIAADHGGFAVKNRLKEWLTAKGYHVHDMGPADEARSDYPDFAQKACRFLLAGQAQKGILICGSGIGMDIAANRFQGIRAARVTEVTSARLARAHNDANILALGARITGEVVMQECIEAFLTTAFEGGRHQDRNDKLEEGCRG
jgi:ribose 5-phosphate isomerase B